MPNILIQRDYDKELNIVFVDQKISLSYNNGVVFAREWENVFYQTWVVKKIANSWNISVSVVDDWYIENVPRHDNYTNRCTIEPYSGILWWIDWSAEIPAILAM